MMRNYESCTLLSITFAKIAFGILFIISAAYSHSSQRDELEDICNSNVSCYLNFIGGLQISGSILLFISIVAEGLLLNYFDRYGLSVLFYSIHALGSLCIMGAVTTDMEILKKGDYYYYNIANIFQDDYTFRKDDKSYATIFWIAGGSFTCIAQAGLIISSKFRDFILILSHFTGVIGSLCYVLYGILYIETVIQGLRIDFNETYKSINDIMSWVLIAGSVTYILHSFLFFLGLRQKFTETAFEAIPHVQSSNLEKVNGSSSHSHGHVAVDLNDNDDDVSAIDSADDVFHETKEEIEP